MLLMIPAPSLSNATSIENGGVDLDQMQTRSGMKPDRLSHAQRARLGPASPSAGDALSPARPRIM